MSRAKPGKARTERSRASSNAQRDSSPRGKRVTEKAAEIAGSSKGDANQPYKQTPAEIEAIDAFASARKKQAPRLKVVVTGRDAVTTDVDHPDNAIGTIALM
jgi:hypothetical protein